MLKIKLPKNRMQFLIEELEKQAELPVLERGWEYYHRGSVGNVNLVQGHILEADVRGKNHTFHPALNLETFSKSECNCSKEGICRHMASLVFYAYSSHGRPELLLLQLKQTIAGRKRQGRAAAARAAKPQEPVTALAAEGMPKEWVRFFDQRFHGYSLSNQHSVEQFHQAVWETLGDKAADWPEELQALYRLHLILYVLRKIDLFHQENQSSYLSYYIENGCKLVAGQSWEKLREVMVAFPSDLLAEAYPKHWKETAAAIGETVVRSKAGPVHWLDVYRYLWSKLTPSPERVEKERRRLSLLLEQPQPFPRVKDGLLLALAHFDLLDGEDQAALQRLEELHTKQFSDFYIVLDQFMESGEWERLLHWLRWLLPVLVKSKQEDFNKGCVYWVEAMKHQPSDEEWIRVMLSLLPRSYYYYADYLMQTRRYRQWVDLQLATGVTPANLYTAELRIVEAHDPALLLPLFHQSIEKAILEKNRDSYKLAIKQLKKLHALYKQLGRTKAWEDFIAGLSAKYARLRAFREELTKGQWTS